MATETSIVKNEPQSLVQSDQRPAVTPACDIYENKDEVLLVADLPGVAPDALALDLDKDVLTLTGTRTLKSEGNCIGYEFRECDFRRRFVVPSGIDRNKIRAELKNGVLQLHLPKAEALKPRQISVTGG